MPTKDQLSDDINEILGTNLDFSRMPKSDLKLFHELVHDGDLVEPLAKQVAKEKGQATLEDKVDGYYVGKYISKLV